MKTKDDYILNMFRIPYSHRIQNQNKTRPVVFLQHGLLCSSDSFLASGADNALAYNLADAGYDVWLGNARGNTYSRQHKHITPESSEFWNFSWHEIGVYDLASMLDYVLVEANSTQLHFVAHSQGTTTFLVLMSTLPQYNEKVKTVHLLAPVAFLRSHASVLSKVGRIFLGYPSFLCFLLQAWELLPITHMQRMLCEYVCSEESMLKFMCSGLLDFIGGWGTQHLNHVSCCHYSFFKKIKNSKNSKNKIWKFLNF